MEQRNVFRLPRLPAWVKYAAVMGALTGTCIGAGSALRYQVWKQPSGSMWPTLQVSERTFALRGKGLPARGQIAFFKYPEHPDQSFVKRVVGLPGDVIETKGVDVVINGWTVPRCVVGKTSYVEPEGMHVGELDVEWLGAETYLVFHEDRTGAPDAGPFTVRAGEYFVLGDNRENSHDSRFWFGGRGGGVPVGNTQGMKSMALDKLPEHLDALLSSPLKSCLAKRPAQTSPPPR